MPTVSQATLLPAGTLIDSGRLSCENFGPDADMEPQAASRAAAAMAPVRGMRRESVGWMVMAVPLSSVGLKKQQQCPLL